MLKGKHYGDNMKKAASNKLKPLLGFAAEYYSRDVDHDWGMYWLYLCLTRLTISM